MRIQDLALRDTNDLKSFYRSQVNTALVAEAKKQNVAELDFAKSYVFPS